MRPKVLVARAVFPEVLDYLRGYFEVQANTDDHPFSRDELISALQGKAGALISLGEHINADVLDACPDLKVVCNIAVGCNNLDIPALTRRGVLATNTPGVLDEATADLTWALLLAAARRITEAEAWLRAGEWKGWVLDQMLGCDVNGATLGIIGMGRIGQAVARRAGGFAMKIIYHNRHPVDASIEQKLGATYRSLDALLAEADFVSLNLPYSADSHHLIGGRELGLMKQTGVLINTARGGIVDDVALLDALANQRIAAAGLDVFEGEPGFNPGFLALKNVVLTPHIGSSTRRTRMNMAMLAAQNLVAALSGGRPITPVNPEVLHA